MTPKELSLAKFENLMNSLQAILVWLSVISSALAMLGCDSEPKTYYPLKEGKRWVYQMGAGGMFGGSASTQVVVTNLGQRELNGRKVTAQKIDAGGQSYFAFIGQDEKGVYEFAIYWHGQFLDTRGNNGIFLWLDAVCHRSVGFLFRGD